MVDKISRGGFTTNQLKQAVGQGWGVGRFTVPESRSAALEALRHLWSFSCSTAALTPAGCHNHKPPAGGARRACLHGDPGPWP